MGRTPPARSRYDKGAKMNLGRKMLLVAGLSVGLLAATAAGAESGPLADEIAQHEQKLAQARQGKGGRAVAMELNALGTLYRQSGKLQKALDYLNEALPIDQDTGNQVAQAITLNGLGRVYTDLGQEDKALALFNQALVLWRELGLQQGEASTLSAIGEAYNYQGRQEAALKRLNEALSIWHEIDNMGRMARRRRDLHHLKALKELMEALPNWREAGGRAGEASTLDSLGSTYSALGQAREAMNYFNQALPIWRQEGERRGEALTLNNMGRAYADLGEKQKSLESFNRALAIWREIGLRLGEALTLNNLGRLYRDLGLQQTALDYYNHALAVWREVGARVGEALALNDIGRAYADMGQPRQALEYSAQALPIWRATGARRGEAATLNNMGRDYSLLGEAGKALDFDAQALAIWREVKDRRGEALALMSIGWAYAALKEKEKALAATFAALSLIKAAGDPEIEGGIETSLMIGFRNEHRPEEAIFFGMEAVNSYQQIRQNLSGMEKELQAEFVQSKSGAYRVLAELLVEADRLGEAEQVLDLLKEEELRDIVRGASPDAAPKVEPLKLTAAQQKARNDMAALEKKGLTFGDINVEYAVLEAKATRTHQEDAQLKTLNASIEQEKAEILALFINTVCPELERKPGPDPENGHPAAEKFRPELSPEHAG